jgi:GDP-4-dehydro-6-deoxy-D-mannose reductase
VTRALVTGAGGFIGRHLVRRLERDGYDVVPLTRAEADLTDPHALAAAVRAADPDVAFHLAAARSKGSPADRVATATVNALSGLWLVESLPERCQVVVRLGSSTEYAESDLPMDEETPLAPRGFFGRTKAAGSLLLTAAAHERGIRSAVLRAFQVYGPGDKPTRFVPSVLRAAREGTVLPLTEPGHRRDWVWVGDVVDACVRAARASDLPSGEVLNIGTGVQTTNEALVALASRVAGVAIQTDVGAHPGAEWDTSDWVADSSRAKQLLGWQAETDLLEGLVRCCAAEL